MNYLNKLFLFLINLFVLIVCATPSYAESIQVASTKAEKAPKSLLVGATSTGERIFTVGGRGHILYSNDHGVSWTQAQSPTQMLLTAIYFIDNKIGWAVGHDSIILGTVDGGEKWRILFEAPKLQQPFLDLVFFDAKNGLVVGAYGSIMRTSDGGKTWQSFMIGELDWHFNSIIHNGDKVLIAGEAGTLARSFDAGKNWEQLASPYVGSFFGLIAQATTQNPQIIAYGLRGHAFITKDFGDSWSQLDTGVSTNILGGTYTPSGDALLLGSGGTLLHQIKGQSEFNKLPYRGFENLTSIIAINDSELVVFGVRGTSRLTIP